MVSIKRLKEKSASVNSIVENIVHSFSENEDVQDLENEYGELYSIVLDVIETLDAVISDIEK